DVDWQPERRSKECRPDGIHDPRRSDIMIVIAIREWWNVVNEWWDKAHDRNVIPAMVEPIGDAGRPKKGNNQQAGNDESDVCSDVAKTHVFGARVESAILATG